MNAADIRAALAVKYTPPEWCVYFEVSNDTGASARRYADAVAMAIWPSRGYVIHGFEIKVSRSDFMAEMRAPEKADAVGRFCDYWWLATPPKLVDPAELPATWGLMELTGSGLRVKKQAPQRSADDLTRGFVAALIRRGQDLQQAHIRAEVERGEADRQRRVEAEIERRTKELRERVQKQGEWIKTFEQALGEDFATWRRPEKFAERLRLAERLGDEWGQGTLQRLKASATDLVKAIEEAALVSDGVDE